MARPTLYTAELLEKAREYYTKAKQSEIACPSVAELALVLDVSRSTVYLFQKEHAEFSDIVEKILTLQELQLTSNGLTGKYNASITKLMLTKHGYSDKQELTGKDGEKLELGVVILPAKNGTDENTLATPTETGDRA